MSTTSKAPENITTWTIDPAHTQVNFEVRHMMLAKVRGRFTELEGTLRIAPVEEESTASVVIKAASIDTGQSERDEHLRSADFFDVDQFAELTFEGTNLRRSEGSLLLVGDLKIRDVVRPVELEVEESGQVTDPWGNERIAFSATTTLDRRDYGLTWNQALETGGILVGNEIRITIEVQAIQSAS